MNAELAARKLAADAHYAALAVEREPIEFPMVPVADRKIYFDVEANRGNIFEGVMHVRGSFKHQGRIAMRYSVTWGNENYVSRREYGGPIVTGEHGYLSPQATVIAATPIERPDYVEVRDGDVLKFGDILLQIRDDKALQNPRLVRIF